MRGEDHWAFVSRPLSEYVRHLLPLLVHRGSFPAETPCDKQSPWPRAPLDWGLEKRRRRRPGHSPRDQSGNNSHNAKRGDTMRLAQRTMLSFFIYCVHDHVALHPATQASIHICLLESRSNTSKYHGRDERQQRAGWETAILGALGDSWIPMFVYELLNTTRVHGIESSRMSSWARYQRPKAKQESCN